MHRRTEYSLAYFYAFCKSFWKKRPKLHRRLFERYIVKENRSACRKKITAQGMKQELFHIKLDKHPADNYNGNRRW